jgi:hypothetical protein
MNVGKEVRLRQFDMTEIETRKPTPIIEQLPDCDYPIELQEILEHPNTDEERRYSAQDVIDAHNLAKRTWEQLAEGFRLERNIMQQQAMDAQAKVDAYTEGIKLIYKAAHAWYPLLGERDAETILLVCRDIALKLDPSLAYG